MIQGLKTYLITGISALGAAFCLVSLGEGHPLCATAGCELYSNYKLLGFSLYGWGLLGFGLLAILAGPGCKPQLKQPLYSVLCLALTIDIVLLGYQALLWPCSSCLFVAALVGLAAIAGYWVYPYCRTCTYRVLTGAWLILFTVVAVSMVKEVALRPWVMYGAENAPVQIYFSPTCQACQSVALQLLDGSDGDKVAFIPVAKSQEDTRRISVVVQLGLNGPQAVRQLFQENLEGEGRGVGWALLRNKVAMARMGITRVPTIISPFVPETGPGLDGFPFALLASPLPVTDNSDDGCPIITEEPCTDESKP